VKKIVVRIAYNQILSNGSDDDIITFYCPYKGYKVNILRDDIENYVLSNQIDEEEFTNLQNDYTSSFVNTPLEFVLKIKEAEYKYLFREFIDYTKEKKDTDLTKMFTFLKLKMIEVYNDPTLYKKYIDEVDLNGDIDGCTYCEHYSKNGYCNKLKTDKVKKNCIFYKFNKILKNN
jgi:hypothetical protein